MAKKRTKRQTSHHEAGHAFAAWHFGRSIVRAHIKRDADRNINGEVEYHDPLTCGANDIQVAFENAIIALAGAAADNRLRRYTDGDNFRVAFLGDGFALFEASRDLSGAVFGESGWIEGEDLELFDKLAWRMARLLIEHEPHWKAIRALASELIKHEEIDGAEVDGILRESIYGAEDQAA